MALVSCNRGHLGPTPSFRTSSNDLSSFVFTEQSSSMEKRQLFLRSYRFSRKRSLRERIKGSLIKFKKVVWLRLRSVHKLRRVVWSRIRSCYSRRQKRFRRLVNSHNNLHSSSSCLW